MKFFLVAFFVFILISYQAKGSTLFVFKNETKGHIFEPADSTTTPEVHPVTRWIRRQIIKPTKTPHKKPLTDPLQPFEGKTISEIKLQPLAIFGPSFSDTTRLPRYSIETFGNKIHTRTNPRIIEKNLRVYAGDKFSPKLLEENEKAIRDLPYIKDAHFLVEDDSLNPGYVKLTLLTKDVFSFGASAQLYGTSGGSLKVFNSNMFGIGHELSARFVERTNETPTLGAEIVYTSRNIGGHFIDISTGYADTYKRRGFLLDGSRPFETTETKWGGGFTFYRFDRTTQPIPEDPVVFSQPMNYKYIDFWQGLNFTLPPAIKPRNSQITLTGRIRHLTYYERPDASSDEQQYYTNSTLYLFGLTHSYREYQRGSMIYSYGVTEDIPTGFLNEIVVGYDDNEGAQRAYTHLVISHGFNIARAQYLYLSIKAGGYWNAHLFEQGQLEANLNFISGLYQVPFSFLFRQFIQVNYIRGINRYDIENLNLQNQYGIRGFSDPSVVGKQRLTLRTESVFFHKHSLWGFNSSIYTLGDLGLIGSNQASIFDQKLYAGLGIGIRIKNESLVFNVIEFQLTYYPGYHFRFDVNELTNSSFNDFQPGKPTVLQFR